MPGKGSLRSAPSSQTAPAPVPRAARAQPSCPTIVITSAGPAAGPRLAGLAPPAYGLRRDFLGARRAPELFDSQGRGGIESARLPLLWTFVAVCLGGQVEWEGRTRWDPAAPAPTRNRPVGNEWLLLIRPRRLRGSRAKGHELLTEPRISLRSDASTRVPLSAGEHACLARPSRIDLRGTPRATGSRSPGEGGGDE